MKPAFTRFLAVPLLVIASGSQAETNSYPWLHGTNITRDVAGAIAVPAGYERTREAGGSFADWLRHLPLKKAGTPVYLFDGTEKKNQDAHFAVIDIDTGKRDLQQCADAIIRLRAEYLYSKGGIKAIHFDFTSGDTAMTCMAAA